MILRRPKAGKEDFLGLERGHRCRDWHLALAGGRAEQGNCCVGDKGRGGPSYHGSWTQLYLRLLRPNDSMEIME